MFVMMALPGTQGFYSFVCGIMMIVLSGVLDKGAVVSSAKGLSLMAVGIGVGLVEAVSAVLQGRVGGCCRELDGTVSRGAQARQSSSRLLWKHMLS